MAKNKKELGNKDRYSIMIYADKTIDFYNDMATNAVVPEYSFKITEAEIGYLDRVEENDTVLGKNILKRWNDNMDSHPTSICAFVFSRDELLYAYEINPNNENIKRYNANEVYMRNGMEFSEIRTHRKNYLVKEIARLGEVINSQKRDALINKLIGGAATLGSLITGKVTYDQIRFGINRELNPVYNQVINEHALLATYTAMVTAMLVILIKTCFGNLKEYWKLKGGRNKLQSESDTIIREEGRRRS